MGKDQLVHSSLVGFIKQCALLTIVIIVFGTDFLKVDINQPLI